MNPPDPPRDPPIFWWGDWESDPLQWSNAAFTDGSGMWSSQPGIRACGWGVVQLSASGTPLR
eukprot:3587368-Pyramimonas_sp.AAC.1